MPRTRRPKSPGAPAPEGCGGPIAFESLRDLFTTDYIVHRLAEMLDEGWKPEHVAELRQLRPWMDRAFAETNGSSLVQNPPLVDR